MKKVILAGNPNTGKTTLFNTLTGANEHASNWHGVTVDVKNKHITYKGEEFEVYDLPGLYSLDAYSKEEKIASEFIEKNKDAVVVCILDANNLKRNLYLALELKKKTPNLVLAVNMAKEVKSFDAKKLESVLGVKTVSVDARKKKSAKELKEVLADFALSSIVPKPLQDAFNIEEFEKKSKATFTYITDILNQIGYQPNGYTGESKLDKIVLSKFGSLVIFVLVMGLVFFITFGFVGDWFSGLFTSGITFVNNAVSSWLSSVIKNELLCGFITDGVLAGTTSVLSFIPQIILMFMCLNFLEDIGYLSRVAFMFDPLFKHLGLTGRSAFSLIMGFGCTTTAIMTTRNLDNKSLQKRTAYLLPFMSCSAKLPIYAVIISCFFSKYKALIVFSLYLFAILVMTLVALIMKAKNRDEEPETFLLEMPKYRVPSVSKVLKGAMTAAKNFLMRVGGAIVLSSMIVYLMLNLNFKLQYTSGDDSMLLTLAGFISPIFKPLGFGNKGAVIAIITGIFAKEMVVSSLAIINGVSVSGLALSLSDLASPAHFTSISAISFLVFVLLYTPCISALISMRKEVGSKVTVKSAFLQLGLAYVLSMLIYNTVNSLITKAYGIFALMLILIALFMVVMVFYMRKVNIKKVDLCKTCNAKCK